MRGPLEQALGHLARAKEFLDEAQGALTREYFSTATSNAIVAGINAKDAICLKLTGKTAKGQNHQLAVFELRAAGREAAVLATTFDRLLKPKTRSQYTPLAVARKDAEIAVSHAEKLVDAAARIVADSSRK
ncbi:MAG: hypothetical protein QOJ66_362 [Ilumatobacteraceae bacterium]